MPPLQKFSLDEIPVIILREQCNRKLGLAILNQIYPLSNCTFCIIFNMEKRPKTIFCDIDGTLIKHHGNLTKAMQNPGELLEGTIETLNNWEKKGYKIILTTGRKESMRACTEKLLFDLGIFYDYLLMGIGGGERVLINDKKLNSEDDTCFAYNLVRNKGVKDLYDI